MEELNVDEKVDPANRLRLSQKYCGIYICNTSDSNEIVQFYNHLVVVGMEHRQVRDYANKMGSVLVSDL